ncbi:hypothetical protein [Candidatus Binatus sp.]|uniref:hypothetical protein n=1 Tax=Candidatus Binatus sp. TaxID=2811406 RepID=UPI003BB1B66E
MGNAAATFDLRPRADVRTVAAERTAAIPWYVWCLAAATAADLFGGYWDISWHISIGRDTFWTPAHMMIYLAGVLAGVASGYAILSTTFGSSQEAKDASISVWGFRGPLGCFMAAWGGFAMLTSAPFDNWWHNAYGLDVKIVSLPHSMLGIGELMIELGAMLLVCAHLNRATGAYQRKLDWLLLVIGGIVVAGSALFILESTPMEFMHSSSFYRAVATAFPVALIAITVVSKKRWPATTMAAIYTALFLAGLWIFPLFPAAPKLGPVYQNITHMVPLWFPVLVIVPAFALDLLRARMGEKWGGWKSAITAGFVFIAAFVAAQWPFADFLISPAARNPIFGANYFGFFDAANLLYNPYHFAHLDKTEAAFREGMMIALVTSIIFCSIGMALGNWMRTVRR